MNRENKKEKLKTKTDVLRRNGPVKGPCESVLMKEKESMVGRTSETGGF